LNPFAITNSRPAASATYKPMTHNLSEFLDEMLVYAVDFLRETLVHTIYSLSKSLLRRKETLLVLMDASIQRAKLFIHAVQDNLDFRYVPFDVLNIRFQRRHLRRKLCQLIHGRLRLRIALVFQQSCGNHISP
jgi:hypothetical protein